VRKLTYLLILTGFIVFIYPIYTHYSSVAAENALLKMWDDREVEDPDLTYELGGIDSFYELEEIFLNANQETQFDAEIEEEPEVVTEVDKINSNNLLGIIEIERISVKLPILAGASDENLKKGAGHLVETSKLGEVGNAAVAAHRSRTYGRQFNRLDEIEVGDEITIITDEQTYTYTVFETKIVKPTDVYVLNKMGDKRVLTLITCDPVVNATHRLIVHAELK
jgi:sortase A